MRLLLRAAFLAAFLLAQGCVREMEEPAAAGGATGGMHEVRIVLSADAMAASADSGSGRAEPDTRSAVGDNIADDSGIYDVNVAIYDDRGMLMFAEYMTGQTALAADVPYGEEYTVFALANVGEVEMPSDMGQMEQWRYGMSSVSGLSASGGLPMCGKTVFSMRDGDVPVSLHIALRRLAAEIVLSFRCKDGLEVDLDSVSLGNVPLEALPFSESAPPVARGGGDYATGYDIGNLMDGSSIRLYMLEDLYAGQESPYVSVKGKVVNSSGLVSADVDYRLCLDWEIRRNSRYVVPFAATADGIYEDSDRVEVRDGVLQISPVKVSLHVGDSVRLDVPASRFAGISYSSDDPSVAAVDPSGKITGCSPGTTVIRASCPVPDAAGSCEVEVYSLDTFTDYSSSLSEYARAWGEIDFPSASGDDPVMVVYGEDTIRVGRDLPDGRDMQIVRCGSHELYYVPSGSMDKVYVWNAKALGSTRIRLLQGRKYAEMTMDNRAYPRYLFNAPRTNSAELVDTGQKVEFFLYLADGSGDYLDLDRFFLPDAVEEAMGESFYDELFWDYLDCLEISGPEVSGSYLETEILRYGWKDSGEDYLAAGTMCILKSDEGLPESFVLTLTNGASGFGNMPSTEVTVQVSKAFGGQGFLGEAYNFQIAPGSLASDRICLGTGFPVTAVWDIRRFDPTSAAGLSYEDIWNHADSRFTSLIDGPEEDAGSGKMVLRLLDPWRFSGDEFFANGSYIIRGSIANPVSGDIVRGYYILDIILYVSVISEVDIELKNEGASTVRRTYVPLSVWSCDGAEDFWSNLYPVMLYDQKTGSNSRLNSLVDGNVVDTFEIPEAISDPQHSYDALVRSLAGVFGRGTGDFWFVDEEGQRVRDLRIDRENMSAAGADGYYHFVRQYDSGQEIENYLIEAYYKDFGKY